MKVFIPNLHCGYHILPESIDFIIPGFYKLHTPEDKTLALRQRDCEQWYNEFVDRLVGACGRKFLPVCRMSDGEFLFALGEQSPLKILPQVQRVRQKVNQVKKRLRRRGGFEALTTGHYHSGNYSAGEWREAKEQYADMVRDISEKGILALHLSYGREPFQEHYFPALGRWLQEHKIILTDDNYFPFYFVYAALIGPRKADLLKNRRVLVVNGASGEKRKRIENGLKREGVSELLWCPISLERSLYDQLYLEPFLGRIDLALVGAGIGKPNILIQMEQLNVPCIDAGYVFEIWANQKSRWSRAFCAPDNEPEI